MHSRARRLVFVLLLLCGVPCAAAGASEPAPDRTQAPGPPPSSLADLPLEDLLALEVQTVVSASRFVQDTTQAPASVTVITREEIRLQGYRTLADLLRTVRGFYVSYDRNYSYLGVRGFSRPGDYNTRILLLVDGHRLNDGLFGLSLLGTEFPIDLSVVDRVEIVRGPTSSLYGSSAMLAVVHVFTRRGATAGGTQVAVDAGTLGTVRARATTGGRRADGLEALFSATAHRSAGLRRVPFGIASASGDAPPDAVGLDDDRGASMLARINRGGLSAQLVHASRTKEIPTGAFDTTFGAPGTETVDARGYLSLAYARRLGRATAVEMRVAADWYDYEGRYVVDGAAGAAGVLADTGRVRTLSEEVMLAHRVGGHTLTAGIAHRWHPVLAQRASEGTEVLLDDRRRARVVDLFAQDAFQVGRRVLANVGVGYDHYDGIGGTLTPRAGLIVTATPSGTLKLLAGRAFRAPTAYELYYYGLPEGVALRPETTWTGEVVWEQRVAPDLTISGGAFRSRVSDLITQRDGGHHTVDGLYFDNGSEVAATGAEIEARLTLAPALHAHVSHAVSSVRETATALRLSNAPAHVTTVGLISPLGRSGLVAAAHAYRTSERFSALGAAVPAATVTNLTVSWQRHGGGSSVALSAFNLFDVAHADPGRAEHRQSSILQDGRSLLVRAALRF